MPFPNYSNDVDNPLSVPSQSPFTRTEVIKALSDWAFIHRRSEDYTHDQVAKYLKIHRPSYTEFEHGNRNLQFHEFLNLCLLFDVSPASATTWIVRKISLDRR